MTQPKKVTLKGYINILKVISSKLQRLKMTPVIWDLNFKVTYMGTLF
jgi:hypothetical protein